MKFVEDRYNFDGLMTLCMVDFFFSTKNGQCDFDQKSNFWESLFLRGGDSGVTDEILSKCPLHIL